MTKEIKLKLPFPPSANNLFFNVPGRGRVKTPQYRNWRQVASLTASLAAGPNRPHFPKGERVRLRIVAYAPDKRRRDLSNLIKAIEDACTEGGIWADDSQVKQLQAEFDESSNCGEVLVEAEGL